LPTVAIASVGLGVRGSLGSDTTFRLDYARVIDAGPGSRGMRMHGLVTYVF
jgi:hemolysin activation/secretion protein